LGNNVQPFWVIEEKQFLLEPGKEHRTEHIEDLVLSRIEVKWHGTALKLCDMHQGKVNP
jgi:hypothetical protein